ncbi:hypothetical protein COU37_05570 [Candidatus Micrarchaeota archaeon CG10_big_fil_rev_8_21_14_0_10_45_29]|nr:MAG: hypothetical protein COU37_05570 [Candidatus Micrarchaeota archaeon CG10_big_fil_rev_8_21_14_0_10_45_29]
MEGGKLRGKGAIALYTCGALFIATRLCAFAQRVKFLFGRQNIRRKIKIFYGCRATARHDVRSSEGLLPSKMLIPPFWQERHMRNQTKV